MGKIRHLAIKTPDPERLAKFYQLAFDMQLQHRSKNGFYLTDGYLTLALLKVRPGDAPAGINHFGFEVEDADETCRKLVALGLPEPMQRPSHVPFAELRGMDPDGNLYDISQHGYVEVEYSDDRKTAEHQKA